LIRNKALSHRDAAIDLNAAFRLANITPLQVRALSDEAIIVANAICVAIGAMEVSANIDDLHKDARRVFRALSVKFDEPEPTSALDELFGDRCIQLALQTQFVIPGHRVAMSPEPRGKRHACGPWVPDRALRVRNDE
jgi:hypothetical protein